MEPEAAGAREGLQEMVMERDGKFEVLRAVELQAELGSRDLEPSADGEPAATTAQEAGGDKTEDSKQHSLPGNKAESSAASANTEPQPLQHQSLGVGSDPPPENSDPPPKNRERDGTPPADLTTDNTPGQPSVATAESKCTDNQLWMASTVDDSRATGSVDDSQPSALQRRELEPNQQIQPPLRREVKTSLQIRTQSAPGPRLKRSARVQLEAEEEEEREKKRGMNETAFSAWVSRKNEERIKSARARLKNTATEDDEQKKRDMCEAVYRKWLEEKKRQWQQERILSRPATSVPKKDEEMCRAAFEGWMKKKQTQHLEEAKREQMKTREIADLAEKADPSVIDRVYQQ